MPSASPDRSSVTRSALMPVAVKLAVEVFRDAGLVYMQISRPNRLARSSGWRHGTLQSGRKNPIAASICFHEVKVWQQGIVFVVVCSPGRS
jgi:hypothetical protein